MRRSESSPKKRIIKGHGSMPLLFVGLQAAFFALQGFPAYAGKLNRLRDRAGACPVLAHRPADYTDGLCRAGKRQPVFILPAPEQHIICQSRLFQRQLKNPCRNQGLHCRAIPATTPSRQPALPQTLLNPYHPAMLHISRIVVPGYRSEFA